MPDPPLVRDRGPRESPAIPEFLVEQVDIDGERWLEVTCRRSRCKRMCMVRPAWLQTGNFITKPCTYCWKVGRVPKEMRR